MWVFTLRRASGSAVSCDLRSWGVLGLGLHTACERGGGSVTKRSFFFLDYFCSAKKRERLVLVSSHSRGVGCSCCGTDDVRHARRIQGRRVEPGEKGGVQILLQYENLQV